MQKKFCHQELSWILEEIDSLENEFSDVDETESSALLEDTNNRSVLNLEIGGKFVTLCVIENSLNIEIDEGIRFTLTVNHSSQKKVA